jgi:hypothetical protein
MSKVGYKATANYVCRDQVYEIGKQYRMRKKPICCEQGYHYCLHPKDVLKHYTYDSNFKLLEIEDCSSKTDEQYDKSATDNIKIIREITDPNELYNLLGVYKTFHKNGNLAYKKEKQSCDADYCEKSFDLNENLKTKYVCYGQSSTWTRHTYNSRGLETKYEKSDGYLRTKTYDKKYRLVEEKASDGKFAFIEYNKDGKILNKKSSDGEQIKTTTSRNGNTTTTTTLNKVVTEKVVTNSKGLEIYKKTTRHNGSVEIVSNTYYPKGQLKRNVLKIFDCRGELIHLNDETYSQNGDLLKEKTADCTTENFYKKGRLVKTITCYK